MPQRSMDLDVVTAYTRVFNSTIAESSTLLALAARQNDSDSGINQFEDIYVTVGLSPADAPSSSIQITLASGYIPAHGSVAWTGRLPLQKGTRIVASAQCQNPVGVRVVFTTEPTKGSTQNAQ